MNEMRRTTMLAAALAALWLPLACVPAAEEADDAEAAGDTARVPADAGAVPIEEVGGGAPGAAVTDPPPGRAPSDTPPADAARVEVTGEVVITGSDPAPFVVIQSPTQRPVRVTGALEPDLRALAGATVRARGRHAAGGMAPGGTLEVSAYEVLDIDGERPWVGTLLRRGEELLLAGADTLRLTGVPAALSGHAGAKVWVIGAREGDRLEIGSYGIIRHH